MQLAACSFNYLRLSELFQIRLKGFKRETLSTQLVEWDYVHSYPLASHWVPLVVASYSKLLVWNETRHLASQKLASVCHYCLILIFITQLLWQQIWVCHYKFRVKPGLHCKFFPSPASVCFYSCFYIVLGIYYWLSNNDMNIMRCDFSEFFLTVFTY